MGSDFKRQVRKEESQAKKKERARTREYFLPATVAAEEIVAKSLEGLLSSEVAGQVIVSP